MAASVSIRGRILSKLFHGQLLPAAVVHHQTFCPRWPIGVCPAAFSHTIPVSSSVTETQEPDTLYQRLLVQVKGHDRAVLDSYEFFATLAAQELGLNLEKVLEVPKQIDKLTLLKSVHIFKKHRVQYEMRTHYRNIQISRITGSTARVYLEYIQRNLPEGVAMEITKVALEKIPEHIHEPLWGKTQQTDPDAAPSSS